MRVLMITVLVVAGIFLYVEIAEQGAQALESGGQVALAAQSFQSHELTTALEMYYLDHNHYPLRHDEGMVRDLWEAGILKADTVPFTVSYQPLPGGGSYQLKIE